MTISITVYKPVHYAHFIRKLAKWFLNRQPLHAERDEERVTGITEPSQTDSLVQFEARDAVG